MIDFTTDSFKVNIAENFVQSFSNTAMASYMFAAQSNPWPDDNNPPLPGNSIKNTTQDIYDNLLFGKQITENDVIIMTDRIDWATNTVYQNYDDTLQNLYQTKYYAGVVEGSSYNVFKCLNNNGGQPSTVAPSLNDTSAADTFYMTSDGYQWKYMFTASAFTMNNFSTSNNIPVIPNSNVVANAVSGAIDVVIVSQGGTNYNSYANGYFQDIVVGGDALVYALDNSSSSNADFYKNNTIKIITGKGAGQQRNITSYIVSGSQKRVVLDSAFTIYPDLSSSYEITPQVIITGDGTGAVARAIINPASNSISYIEVSSRGQGYTWAAAQVVSNTGVIENTFVSNTATLRPVIGPPGGHGSDVIYELNSNYVGLTTTFANNEGYTLPTNTSFRTFGVLQNPVFQTVQINLTNISGLFSVNEVVSQNSGAQGTISAYNSVSSQLTLVNVTGVFNTNDILTGLQSGATAMVAGMNVNGVLKFNDKFDQRTRLAITMDSIGTFSTGANVYQNTTNTTGIINEANTTFIALTNVKGVIDTKDVNADYTVVSGINVADVSAVVYGDLVKNSGKVLYIENGKKIQRDNSRSELIKLVIGF